MIGVTDCEPGILIDTIKNHAPDYDVLIFGSRYRGTEKDYRDFSGRYSLS